MYLHRVLMLYYGFLMQIFIKTGECIQFSNENSTQIEIKNFTIDVQNKENYSNSSQLRRLSKEGPKKLRLSIVKNEKLNCTKNFRKRHIHDVLLKRHKRLVIFPQDTAFKCTLTMSKALISSVPKGLNLFYEWDAFYQVPDSIEKWKPTHKPDHHTVEDHHVEISGKDPKPPSVPDDVSDPEPPPVPSQDSDDNNMKDNDNAMDDDKNTNEMMMNNMMDNMMNGDNNDDHNITHDYHHGESWNDSYWSSGSFPYYPHGDSEKIYPTPPPGWMNDDDNNTKNMDLLSLHPDVPPPPPSPMDNNNDSSVDTNDEQKTSDEKRRFYKQYDSRNNWNRKYKSVPIKSYHRYLDNPKFPNYNYYQKPFQQNYYYKDYQTKLPMKWKYQYQQQPYNTNLKQSFTPSQALRSWGKRKNYISNKRYEWYDHRGHRERREIYDELEKYGMLFGFPNIRYCIFRTICEVRNYLLPRGVSLIHDIIRVIFTLPYKENWSDDFLNEIRDNKRNCRLTFEKTCPFSLLEYALFSNQNNIQNTIKIS